MFVTIRRAGRLPSFRRRFGPARGAVGWMNHIGGTAVAARATSETAISSGIARAKRTARKRPTSGRFNAKKGTGRFATRAQGTTRNVNRRAGCGSATTGTNPRSCTTSRSDTSWRYDRAAMGSDLQFSTFDLTPFVSRLGASPTEALTLAGLQGRWMSARYA